MRGCDDLRDHQAHSGLFDDELEFVAAVGGVDVDEDRSDLRRGILHERPFADVLRPDADPVALLHSTFEKADGQCVGVTIEVGVRPPPIRMPVDQCQRFGIPRGGAFDVLGDGDPEQRFRRCSRRVGQFGHCGVLPCMPIFTVTDCTLFRHGPACKSWRGIRRPHLRLRGRPVRREPSGRRRRSPPGPATRPER